MTRLTMVLAAFLLCLQPAQGEQSKLFGTNKNQLLQFEKSLGLDKPISSEREAILHKDLELRRSEFVRAAQLNAEGIVALKDVEHARTQYEKILIQIGAYHNKLAPVVEALAKAGAQL